MLFYNLHTFIFTFLFLYSTPDNFILHFEGINYFKIYAFLHLTHFDLCIIIDAEPNVV
jgi:hypothetical protein